MADIRAFVKFRTSATDGTDARLILRNATRPEHHRGFDAVVTDGTAEFEINGLSVGNDYVWTFVTCADSGAVQFEEHGRITVFRKKYSMIASDGCAAGDNDVFGGAVISGDLTGCKVLKFSVR
ncbi:MAG: hypothetical protein J6112_01120 [Clostridia bacterium]|nr:hypothetical protein [Clostridia bacterium]